MARSQAQTLTLTDFLLARIAEDEAVAREVDPDAWGYDVTANREAWADGDRVSVGVGRVLAECEAKRRIVELHTPGSWTAIAGVGDVSTCPTCAYLWDEDFPRHPGVTTDGELAEERYPCSTLQLLALPYADHPDYDEAWRP